MREEFEAWHHAEFGYVIAEEDDPAQDGQCAERWKTWKASRAALMKDYVPMPRQCPSWLEDTYDDVACPDTNYIGGLCLPAYEAMLKAQEEALQQAGIEVK
ncbi:hypothetical protein KK481_014500 [Pseudomonas aeruginosa]|uniref:hypothetical protein n=1 Tax=Pseudomonas aeruginosa TaxID=287 RepID=UPI001E39C858|nr:hypothetical protein [Pseudomonas aeruginosa]UEM37448.1 hypothetical protein KK481_014500 [Pseudomonas aeruginosa]